MKQLIIKLNLLWVRLLTAYTILFHPGKHWFFVHFDKEQLIHLLKREDFTTTIMIHKLQVYNVNVAIRMMKSAVDEDDLLLQRIAFETEAELRNK